MQPYFFPYIGYWQLMALTDIYVIYDDVNFIKGGWINRNRILGPDGPFYINVPCKNAGSGIKICDVGADISPTYLRKTSNKLAFAYRRAPYFEEVYPFIFDLMSFQSDSLADYLANSVEKIALRLGIGTTFIRSSKVSLAPELSGQMRVIEICRQLGATAYLNAIGGVKLYNCAEFEKAGITLKFVKTGDIRYAQTFGSSKAADQFCPDLFGSSKAADQFCPDLSIIDVLMNTGWEGTRELLTHRIVYDAKKLTDKVCRL
jgi:hypothetical protein